MPPETGAMARTTSPRSQPMRFDMYAPKLWPAAKMRAVSTQYEALVSATIASKKLTSSSAHAVAPPCWACASPSGYTKSACPAASASKPK